MLFLAKTYCRTLSFSVWGIFCRLYVVLSIGFDDTGIQLDKDVYMFVIMMVIAQANGPFSVLALMMN